LNQIETAITALASLHAWSPTAPQTLSYVGRIYRAINHFSSSHIPSDLHIANTAMPFLFIQSLREGYGAESDVNTLHDPDAATWMRHNHHAYNMDLSAPSGMFEDLPKSTHLELGEGLAWLTELSMYPPSMEVELPEY
jgi:hypothetical protein